jgi:chromosomal replication initiator protein
MIKDVVCNHFGISREELTGPRRPRRVVIPRHIAMYLSYELTDSTLQAIGASFGGRDHTTVVNACKKMEDEIREGTQVAETIKVLKVKLKEMVGR